MCKLSLFIISILVGLFVLTMTGNFVCKILLNWSGLVNAMQSKDSPNDQVNTQPRVGRLIGIFERVLMAGGIFIGEWEIWIAVIALKTVARFKELDERLDAEYFLVGSLFSMVWAIVITYAWIAYDQYFGYNILALLRPGQ